MAEAKEKISICVSYGVPIVMPYITFLAVQIFHSKPIGLSTLQSIEYVLNARLSQCVIMCSVHTEFRLSLCRCYIIRDYHAIM